MNKLCLNKISRLLKPSLAVLALGGCWLLLSSCSSLPIKQLPSHNASERIKFLVMHYTALNYQDSVTALVDEGGVSAHYLLPMANDPSYPESSLSVMQLVKESARAWHAGNSYWQGRRDLNDHSIGIEIVNVPQCPESLSLSLAPLSAAQHCTFPAYDAAQIELLIKLSQDILRRNPDIGPTQVIGHGDITPSRKLDPGKRFPWLQLHQAGIGAWFEQKTLDRYRQLFTNKGLPSIGLIQRALRRYGYGVLETGVFDQQTSDALGAMQTHFMPQQITGQLDSHSAGVIFALVERYFPQRAEQLVARYQRETVPPAAQHQVVNNGQIDQVFPHIVRSSRDLVNDRQTFKSYAGRGHIVIKNRDAKSADIYVNGQKLHIRHQFDADDVYRYSLARRTRDGINTLRVDNVLPQGASVNITVPFSTLFEANKPHLQRFELVDQLIEREVTAGFPGAVLLVVKNGEIIKQTAYGYARKFADGGELLERPIKMSTDTVFDIASNTKMFATNLALMKLVSEGQLDVNLPLNHYLTDYRGDGREQRLVRDMLTHQGGYAPQVRFFSADNKLGAAYYSQDQKTTKELILTKVPFDIGRNIKHVYSDTDFMLLGMLVERITGMGLDEYVEQAIYQPLGLVNTRFNPLAKGFSKGQFAATEIHGTTRGNRVDFPNVRRHVLQGEVHDEKAFHSFAGVAGHAGLFSTARELAVMAQMLLNRGGYGELELFKPAVVDQFTKPEPRNGSFGLGWRRAGNGALKWHFGPYASPSAYGHTGWTGTVTVIDPEHDLAIILLTNVRHSQIEGDHEHPKFVAKKFETGRYGSIISLVYEAVLNR